jgi:hypothetical protein
LLLNHKQLPNGLLLSDFYFEKSPNHAAHHTVSGTYYFFYNWEQEQTHKIFCNTANFGSEKQLRFLGANFSDDLFCGFVYFFQFHRSTQLVLFTNIGFDHVNTSYTFFFTRSINDEFSI